MASPLQAAANANGDGEDDGNYRASSQFKTHLKKSEAASEFSRTKTMAQQRRALPVYQIREELLQVCTVRGRSGSCCSHCTMSVA